MYELYCSNLEKLKRLHQQNAEKVQSNFSVEVYLYYLFVYINLIYLHYIFFQTDENQRILEKAIAILQNDVVSAVIIEHDKKYFHSILSII